MRQGFLCKHNDSNALTDFSIIYPIIFLFLGPRNIFRRKMARETYSDEKMARVRIDVGQRCTRQLITMQYHSSLEIISQITS